MSSVNRQEHTSGSTAKRMIWLGISALGSLTSLFINLYVDEIRSTFDWKWASRALPWFLYSAVLVGCSYTAWHARGWALSHKRDQQRVIAKSIPIRTEDLEDDLPADQAVIGRKIRYLERVTDSPFLVVCLHGLGLDANDFVPYMQVASDHTVAITQFGFNNDEAHDPRYRPIGLNTHAELLSGAINNLHRQHPGKRLVLVGFSLGADMLLRLAELWRESPGRCPDIAAVLLLDPNINHSTMVVSGAVASLDTRDPLTELKKITNLPTTLVEFVNICEYLHKITTKNLAQVRQFAADVYSYWGPDGEYERFLQRIGELGAICGRVKIVFSVHYEDHFNDIVASARQRRLSRDLFVVEEVDHFDLLREPLLRREIALLTRNNRRRG